MAEKATEGLSVCAEHLPGPQHWEGAVEPAPARGSPLPGRKHNKQGNKWTADCNRFCEGNKQDQEHRAAERGHSRTARQEQPLWRGDIWGKNERWTKLVLERVRQIKQGQTGRWEQNLRLENQGGARAAGGSRGRPVPKDLSCFLLSLEQW